MKSKRFFQVFMIGTALASLTLMGGCKKEDNSSTDDFETEGQAMGQTEDVNNDIDNSVAEAFDLHGSGSMNARYGNEENGELGNCATVTVDSANSTITIHWNHCIGKHGHLRDGDIIIKYTGGNYWTPKASWDVTFNNFYIDDKHVTGTRHVDNMGPAGNGMTWNISADLTFTRPSGVYRTWKSTRTRVLTQGYQDTTVAKIYRINGTATSYHSANGVTASLTFTNLIRDLSCNYITAGIVDITRTNRKALKLDYGNGVCDDQAILYKDGVPHNITLNGPYKP